MTNAKGRFVWAITWVLGAVLAFSAPGLAGVTVKGTGKAFKYNGAAGSVSFTVTGDVAPVTVTAVVAPGVDWIHITSGSEQTIVLNSKGVGKGTVKYTVDAWARSSDLPRQGVIQISDDNSTYTDFTVSQSGVACKVTVSPTSGSYPGSAAEGSFSVTAPEGCKWSAAADAKSLLAGWITEVEPEASEPHSGPGTVTFTVGANDTALPGKTTTKPRAGKIYVTTVAAKPLKKTYSVKQAAGSSGTPPATSGLQNLLFSNGEDLCGMKLDGSGKVVLKASRAFDGYDYFSEMDMSADGKKIAYTAQCGGNGFIRVMGSNLGNPTDLTKRCSGEGMYAASDPAFSPDGTKIAFIGSYNTATEQGDFLSIMNADGTNQHRVSPLAIDPELPGSGLYNPSETSPSFSADGTLIVFSTNRGNGTQLATIKLDGTSMERFDGCTAPEGGCYASDPTPFDPTVDWSTNTIYYSSARNSILSGRPNIYNISIAGTGKVGPLTGSENNPLYRPSVSQDGSKVAFVQISGFSDANIMVLDLDTMTVTTISDSAFSGYNDYPVFVRH